MNAEREAEPIDQAARAEQGSRLARFMVVAFGHDSDLCIGTNSMFTPPGSA